MTDLSVDLGFLRLKNPVIAASGTFGYGLEFQPFIDLNVIGGYVVKGIYSHPRPGNPPPRLAETASGLINAIGLPGIGMEGFVRDILPRLREFEASLIVNVCGENEEEYAAVADFLNGHEGIAAYELNISCPNVRKEGRCPALDPEDTYAVVNRVKKISRRPLITKLSPNVTDIAAIAQSAQEAGSDAVSLVNTFLALAIDADSRQPKIANTLGGLSGPAIKPIALRMVFQAAQRLSIPVIGIGGIMTGEDAVEFLLAGASAVQVGTANFVDPESTVKILSELDNFCSDRGIKHVGDLVGTLETG